MKAAVLVAAPGGGTRVDLAEMPRPTPGAGDMVVDMKACGLCGTDLEKISGDYTASRPVIGHEAVGVVSGVGEAVRGFKVGDRVFPHHHVPDYECYICRSGNETMCEQYRSNNLVPGGFAESFVVPRWNIERGGVLKLPGSMSFEVGSMIEPLACCSRAIRKSGVKEGDFVLIAGAGPVGMMHALLLKRSGARVLLSDVSRERLAFAEKMSLGRVLDAHGDVPAEVRTETQGRGADLAVVASGSKAAVLQALRSVRKGGRVLLFGVPAKGSVLDYDIADLYNSEQSVITSYGAAEADTKDAVKILASRGQDFSRLVTHRFPLQRFPEALAAASGGVAMKVVVTP